MKPEAVTTTFPTGDDPAGGFSLIDMLVALVLLSVVAGLMAAFLGQFRVIMRLQSNVSAQMELDALAAYLEDTIGSALPLPLIEDQGEKRLSFEGTETGVRFVTIARQGVKAFGLRETSLSMKGDGKLRTLVQDFYPRRLDEAERLAAATSIGLAENVETLTFQYLSYNASTTVPVWTDSWRAKSGLPAAVRIKVTARRDRNILTASGYAVLKLSEGASQSGQSPAQM
jgi:type II secretory pathway component PulJ